MSGNSSVCSFHNANKPNTTKATIVTTVIIGRLIAKSEMTIRVTSVRYCWLLPESPASSPSPACRD